uniref:Ion transport domain-containing protein n=1 Tax=Xiphophorus couchianus TaxID=32473 RepID=A0A3B5MCJ5_9TELE
MKILYKLKITLKKKFDFASDALKLTSVSLRTSHPFPTLPQVITTTLDRLWSVAVCIKTSADVQFHQVFANIAAAASLGEQSGRGAGEGRPFEPINFICVFCQAFDAFIYIFFAMEMVIKMVALGIFGRRCYLGDTWNRLDFFIVMAGSELPVPVVRSSSRRVPYLEKKNLGMRILVNLLLDTLPMLGNVLLLCFFVFFIFGIIGVQLWAGLLRNRCYPEENFTLTTGIGLPRPYYMADEDDERPFICSLPVDNGIMSCSDVPARREGGRACCLDKEDVVYRQSIGLSPEPLTNNSVSVAGLCVNWNQYYTRCHTGSSNPHKGAINFDNIAYAWIVIFQVITLEGWVEIMYYVMDAHSFYNFIYFILLIIVSLDLLLFKSKMLNTLH